MRYNGSSVRSRRPGGGLLEVAMMASERSLLSTGRKASVDARERGRDKFDKPTTPFSNG